MTPLLRKLIHDVPTLTDQTIVPLRVCQARVKVVFFKA
jgi:hypothetical protein